MKQLISISVKITRKEKINFTITKTQTENKQFKGCYKTRQVFTHWDSKNNYLQNLFLDFGDLLVVLINIAPLFILLFIYFSKINVRINEIKQSS